ncbi:aminotransferase class III-fold pyridoxal phosphate-dependent enzyme [Rhodovibrionaceae bacterium A322]
MSLFQTPPPAFTDASAADLAKDLFGIAGTAKLLASERDQNFRITAEDGRRFVLKIANPAEERARLDCENGAIEHLRRQDPSLPLPAPQQAAGSDATIVPATDPAGATCLVRLFTYQEGKVLADVDKSPALLVDLGTTLGKISHALQGFYHPAAHRPDFLWNLDEVGQLVDFLPYLSDDDRALVTPFLSHFEEEGRARYEGLRRAVIYNDANDHNVLVDGNLVIEESHVSGIIDFGDMVFSRQVNELAVCLAYTLMGEVSPLKAAVPVIKAYHQAFALQEEEVALLYDLVALRLCTSLCLSSKHGSEQEDNEYLLISQAPARALLADLAKMNRHFVTAVFRDACGWPAVASEPAVVSWLKANQHSFHPVLGFDLVTAQKAVINLTEGSEDLINLGATPAQAESYVDGLFKELGAKTVIGLYNEDRSVYQTDNFISENDATEKRSVHLGIDLFGPAGTAVYAPLDGEVVTAVDNNIELDYGPTIILRHKAGEEGPEFYTLYGHLSRDSLSGLKPGSQIAKGQKLASYGSDAVNGGWAAHLHFQIMTDLLGNDGNFPGAGEPNWMHIWQAITPDANLILGIPEETFDTEGRSKREILEARQRLLGPSLSVNYKNNPLKIVRGQGAYLIDESGRAYLDCVNNITHVGHCHPKVVEAISKQAALLNTNSRYLHDHIIDYSERLTATLPDPLSVCFFVNSGSEANELALRLARTYTGRQGAVVQEHAYHGHSSNLIDMSPYKFDRKGGAGQKPWVRKSAMPDPYRGEFKGYGADSGRAYAQTLRPAIDELEATNLPAALFIAESLPGVGGQIIYPDGYLQAAYEIARAKGLVCIADEVQVGFGRVGETFWGFELQGVVPDIVTIGKPIANGHPMAAVVTTPAIARAFANGMEYFNSFGGNPVSCAAALAVLDVIEEEGLQQNAAEVGAHCLARLEEMKPKHPLIGDVRGKGLFLGAELVRDAQSLEPATEEASAIVGELRNAGFLLSTDGPMDNVLKMKPPMVFSKTQADQVMDELDRVMGRL